MNKYLTIGDAENEIIIQKSKFIAFAYHIETEEDAACKLNALRKKYFDATHICYAYISDMFSNRIKFTDDGEPSGTAGQPILEVIKNRNLKFVLVAVVRYFGGIKLGASGLTRAYSAAAVQVLNKAEVREYIESDIYKLEIDFSLYKKFEKNISNILCKILLKEYNSNVEITIACPNGFDMKTFISDLSSGRTKISLIDRTYIKY